MKYKKIFYIVAILVSVFGLYMAGTIECYATAESERYFSRGWFNALWYYTLNCDQDATIRSVDLSDPQFVDKMWNDYNTRGWTNDFGYSPCPAFDPKYYLQKYPDVASNHGGITNYQGVLYDFCYRVIRGNEFNYSASSPYFNASVYKKL